MDLRLQVLVVDDVDVDRAILRKIFEEDYGVLEAGDGLEALQVLEANPDVALIMLDIIMPKMDGLEFLECIKKDERFQKIPVIVNSQVGEEKNEVNALELGADDFITKPYNLSVIRQRVHNLITKNVLERKQMERNLQETSERLETLIETVPGGIGIFEVGEKVSCQFFNDGLSSMLGYTRTEVEQLCMNWDLIEFVHEEDRDKFFDKVKKTGMSGQESIATYRIRHKSGRYLWIQVSAIRFKKNSQNPVFHAVLTDITKERENLDRLHKSVKELCYRAERDMLTGIYNRETFYRLAERIMNLHRDCKYAIIVWNIEKFKVINDLLGPRVGDEVLKKVAVSLELAMERYGGTIGRLEADHFAVCVPYEYLDMDTTAHLIQNAILELGLNYDVNMNAGVYVVDNDRLPISNMCDRTSLALKTITGSYLKHYAIYDDVIRENLLFEQEIVAEMSEALARGEFFTVFQPVYDAQTEEMVSAEALVRWRHPVKGVIAPGVFIPIFERNGFVSKLDMFLWEEVCRILSEARKAGKPIVPVSVNVSRLDLYTPNLLEEVLALVKRYQLEPSYLKLEITESAYMDNPNQLIQVICNFRKKGFRILMDDFGSGYSSLNMLKDVPVDVLKIDMDFIRNLETSERAGNILSSVVHMAKWLEMEVVAEGVENRNQFDFLKKIGCEQIQGYYFSPPLECEEFLNKIRYSRQLTSDKKIEKQVILVADDMEINRKSVKALLAEDYFVVEAENGADAYEILRENTHSVDLVITDIRMPVMDGFELMQKMTGNPLLSGIPILTITSYSEVENEIEALQLGSNDVLIRPFNPLVLRQRIYNILRVSEMERMQSKVHSMKENNAFKKRFRDMIEQANAAVARFSYDKRQEQVPLQLLYANPVFWEHRGILGKLPTGDMYHILEANMIEGEFSRVLSNMRQAVEQKKTVITDSFVCRYADGTTHNLAYTTVISYFECNIIFNFVELDISSVMDTMLYNKNSNVANQDAIHSALTDARIRMWKYSLKQDRSERMSFLTPDSDYAGVIENITTEYINTDNFHPDSIEKVQGIYRRIAKGEEHIQEMIHVRKADDLDTKERIYGWEWIQYTTIFDINGRPIGAIGIAQDITENYEQMLSYKHLAGYESQVHPNTIVSAEIDLTDNSIVSFNPEILDYIGVSDQISYSMLLDRCISLMVYSQDQELCRNAMSLDNLHETFRAGNIEWEIEYRSLAEGRNRYVWYRTHMRFMQDDRNGHIYVKFIIYNIDEEKCNRLAMEEMAEYDVLTKLFNRVSFEKQVNRILAEAGKADTAAFLMLDLDHFKEVNDTFGHDVGDSTLIDAANCLRKAFRGIDIVGRLGGDEFIVFVPGLKDRVFILDRVNQVLEVLRKEITDGEKTVHISASIGITFAPEEGDCFNALYRKADTALYHSKQNGRNQYTIYVSADKE